MPTESHGSLAHRAPRAESWAILAIQAPHLLASSQTDSTRVATMVGLVFGPGNVGTPVNLHETAWRDRFDQRDTTHLKIDTGVIHGKC